MSAPQILQLKFELLVLFAQRILARVSLFRCRLQSIAFLHSLLMLGAKRGELFLERGDVGFS